MCTFLRKFIFSIPKHKFWNKIHQYYKNSDNFWQNETKKSSLGHVEHPQICLQTWNLHFSIFVKIFVVLKIWNLFWFWKWIFQLWILIWGCSICPRELILVSFCQKFDEFLEYRWKNSKFSQKLPNLENGPNSEKLQKVSELKHDSHFWLQIQLQNNILDQKIPSVTFRPAKNRSPTLGVYCGLKLI